MVTFSLRQCLSMSVKRQCSSSLAHTQHLYFAIHENAYVCTRTRRRNVHTHIHIWNHAPPFDAHKAHETQNTHAHSHGMRNGFRVRQFVQSKTATTIFTAKSERENNNHPKIVCIAVAAVTTEAIPVHVIAHRHHENE